MHANRRTTLSVEEPNIYSDADVYYAPDKDGRDDRRHRRAMSTKLKHFNMNDARGMLEPSGRRRASHDEEIRPRQFLIDVEDTLRKLLSNEDTDRNAQITIEDVGPKAFSLGTAGSSGYNRVDVRGTYMLSNLLQELTLAKDHGQKLVFLDESRLNENPVHRLSRLIRTSYWKALTRKMDGSNIEAVGKDPKDWTGNPVPRIYIPASEDEQYDYYMNIAKTRPEIKLEVYRLPPPDQITGEYIRDLNDRPGILALAMNKIYNPADGKTDLEGVPYVVPGGRFNELYGWDSYFINLGLIQSDRLDLARGMVENFIFCIRHYGKVFNANRSYYLGRSQPPLLTDMVLKVYEKIEREPGALEFLRAGIAAAMKEYYTVWMTAPRYDLETGLSRYRPVGVGVPPETEPSHFLHILEPFAKRHGMGIREFIQKYNYREIECPELDEYFLHDRAVRESGHDTSYRLENNAANLATVDLNSLLHKYEKDIGETIRFAFKNKFEVPPEFQTQENANAGGIETAFSWDRRAKKRRDAMEKYMWNEKAGMYFDYDTANRHRMSYESVTMFWAMWARVATPSQAASLVQKALPMFEAFGGLVSGTLKSRGEVGIDRPSRQWDYPYGWAPQQVLAWVGLLRYGYEHEAQNLAYRWLYMVTKAFVDFNGTVVEKYDVTRPIDPHKVEAEYGNQGLGFKGVSREGFGWVNASYLIGLGIVNPHMVRALGTVTPFETFRKATSDI